MSFVIPVRAEIRDRCGIRHLPMWPQGLIVGIDTETTGTDPTTARILEVALVVTDSAGMATPLTGSMLEIINPGVDVPDNASNINGLTTEYVQKVGVSPKPTLTRLRRIIESLIALDVPLAIFNAIYDWRLLNCEWNRHGITGPSLDSAKLLDPLVIDKKKADWRRGKGKRQLDALCKECGIWLPAGHHAWNDALATTDLVRWQAKKWDLGNLTLSELHKSQETWHSGWLAKFNGYRAKRGEPPIEEKWPNG